MHRLATGPEAGRGEGGLKSAPSFSALSALCRGAIRYDREERECLTDMLVESFTLI